MTLGSADYLALNIINNPGEYPLELVSLALRHVRRLAGRREPAPGAALFGTHLGQNRAFRKEEYAVSH
jgi:hypothetical protein